MTRRNIGVQDSLVAYTAQLTNLYSKARFSNVERKFPNVEHLSSRLCNNESARLCNTSMFTNMYDY